MKLFLLTFFISLNISASSFITCDLTAEVLSLKKDMAKIRVLKVKQGRSGFGDCQFKKGSELEIKIKNPEKIKKEKIVTINYNKYSGMGPKGPVGGVTWLIK